jgi:hypothetical protein
MRNVSGRFVIRTEVLSPLRLKKTCLGYTVRFDMLEKVLPSKVVKSSPYNATGQMKQQRAMTGITMLFIPIML